MSGSRSTRAVPAVASVRHGRQRRSRSGVAAVKLVAAVIAVVALSGVSIAAVAVTQTLSSVNASVHLSHVNSSGPPPQVGAISGAVNLLLAGTDTRTGQVGFQNKADLAGSSGVGNNDVTMVLHISQDHQHATVISIPRDLLLTVPSCPRPGGGSYPSSSMTMFNTTLSRGGLACTVLTAESLTGLTINYAAEISFDGVIGMSNAVGGVTVCLATRVVDPYVNLNLAAGQQTLVGATALAFVRSRHGVGDGSDLGRISDQQLFLSALMRKVTGAGVLSNPITLYNLANAAIQNMVLSDTLSNPTTMVAIAVALKGISLSNMVFVQYPTTTSLAYPGRVVLEPTADRILNAALLADRPIQLPGKLGRATVLAPGGSAAPASPEPTPAAAGAKSTASPAPVTPTPTASAVVLPSDVTGQTAAEQTCTKGN
ncbi:MAG: LytR family transcriptional regulator [Acidobacteria bacterium]|nr:LytR family transcriptional regulator [Acidobacteriota bacterium]